MSVSALKKMWLVLCVLTGVGCACLFSSYLFFRAQVRELTVLQEYEQEHIDVLKRVIADVLTHSDCAPVTTQARATAAKRKQLCQSLRSYLQQKDTNIDVRDLHEIYRSFDQPADSKPEVAEPKESVTPQQTSVSEKIVSAPARVVKKKKTIDKKRMFGWPLEQDRFWVSSFFGKRKIGRGKWMFHIGLDMAALKGTPIRAAADGTVLEAGDSNNGYGNTVLLEHAQGFKTRYAHMERVRVRPQQVVHRGQMIGTVGDTGNVRGNGTDASHLHFEVHRSNRPVNPLYYLAR